MQWGEAIQTAGAAAALALCGAGLLALVLPRDRGTAALPFAVATLFFLALTQLPLPDPATLACPVPDTEPLLEPFRFVRLFRERLATDSFVVAVTRFRGPFAALANLVLCVAIGWTAMPVIRRPLVVMACGTGLSLLVELTQLTGLWGLYPCPYRVFDVDDLILNTAGVAVGVALHGRRRPSRRPS